MKFDRELNVVFLSPEGQEQPWLGDLVEALDGVANLTVLDRRRNLPEQFKRTIVVLDQGGHANREIIDVGAEAGVELWQILGTGLDHAEVDYILSKGIRVSEYARRVQRNSSSRARVAPDARHRKKL